MILRLILVLNIASPVFAKSVAEWRALAAKQNIELSAPHFPSTAEAMTPLMDGALHSANGFG